jgi:hypothetical protein
VVEDSARRVVSTIAVVSSAAGAQRVRAGEVELHDGCAGGLGQPCGAGEVVGDRLQLRGALAVVLPHDADQQQLVVGQAADGGRDVLGPDRRVG